MDMLDVHNLFKKVIVMTNNAVMCIISFIKICHFRDISSIIFEIN